VRSAYVGFLLATLVAAALTPLLRAFARRRGLLDHAIGSRKIHGRPVPRLGGIAIVLAFFAPLAGVVLLRTGLGEKLLVDDARAAAFVAGGLAIAALGLYDDLRGAGALKKLTVQVAVALLLYKCGFKVELITAGLSGSLPIGALSLPLTVLWIVGVINALNLIDGLDGLASGVALFALSTNFAIAAFRGDPLMAFLTAALAGAVLGFLVYNFSPASIFMGDTGSMFLGYVLAAGSIAASQKSSTVVSLLVPVVALGLPIADTLLAIARRAARGRPLFSADKEHIHHRLLALGLTHRQAVIVLYATCVALGGAALLISFANSWQTAAVLTALAGASVLGVRRLSARRPEASEQRRKNLEVRAAVRALGERLRQAADVAQVWDEVRAIGPALGAQELSLEVWAESAEGGTSTLRHGVQLGRASDAPLRVQFALNGAGEPLGALEIAWSDGRSEIDRDHEIAIEILCDHAAAALERLQGPRERAAVIPLLRR
jgi:UDP-GlcNAc:undecaprenyl-phosphate GlcNAc-1-phosphate transferase